MQSVTHFLWAVMGLFCFLHTRILYAGLFGFFVFKKVSIKDSYMAFSLWRFASLLFHRDLTADIKGVCLL